MIDIIHFDWERLLPNGDLTDIIIKEDEILDGAENIFKGESAAAIRGDFKLKAGTRLNPFGQRRQFLIEFVAADASEIVFADRLEKKIVQIAFGLVCGDKFLGAKNTNLSPQTRPKAIWTIFFSSRSANTIS